MPGAVLVVARWNSWVRVLDPVSGAMRWVDLAATEFAAVDADEPRDVGSA